MTKSVSHDFSKYLFLNLQILSLASNSVLFIFLLSSFLCYLYLMICMFTFALFESILEAVNFPLTSACFTIYLEKSYLVLLFSDQLVIFKFDFLLPRINWRELRGFFLSGLEFPNKFIHILKWNKECSFQIMSDSVRKCGPDRFYSLQTNAFIDTQSL